MVVDNFFLVLMLSDPTFVVLEAMNEIYSPSMVDTQMEVTSVGISFLEVSDSRIFTLPSRLQHG